jgi:hypothetical protein
MRVSRWRCMQDTRLRTDGGGWPALPRAAYWKSVSGEWRREVKWSRVAGRGGRRGLVDGWTPFRRESTVRQTYVAPFLRTHKHISITYFETSEFRILSSDGHTRSSNHELEGMEGIILLSLSIIPRVHRRGQQHYMHLWFTVIIYIVRHPLHDTTTTKIRDAEETTTAPSASSQRSKHECQLDRNGCIRGPEAGPGHWPPDGGNRGRDFDEFLVSSKGD